MDKVYDHDMTDFVWTASQISIDASRQVEAGASLLFSDPEDGFSELDEKGPEISNTEGGTMVNPLSSSSCAKRSMRSRVSSSGSDVVGRSTIY